MFSSAFGTAEHKLALGSQRELQRDKVVPLKSKGMQPACSNTRRRTRASDEEREREREQERLRCTVVRSTGKIPHPYGIRRILNLSTCTNCPVVLSTSQVQLAWETSSSLDLTSDAPAREAEIDQTRKVCERVLPSIMTRDEEGSPSAAISRHPHP